MPVEALAVANKLLNEGHNVVGLVGEGTRARGENLSHEDRDYLKQAREDTTKGLDIMRATGDAMATAIRARLGLLEEVVCEKTHSDKPLDRLKAEST